MRKSFFFVILVLFIGSYHDGYAGAYEKTFRNNDKYFVREITETLIAECGAIIYPEQTEISPDGRKIMWLADILGRRGVLVNSEVIGIYEDAIDFVFSPDNKRIAYKIKVLNKDSIVIDGKKFEE